MKKIVIVGGGLGGLSSAVTLAHAGFDVELFEKNNHLGGKLMPVKLEVIILTLVQIPSQCQMSSIVSSHRPAKVHKIT
ncbi:NAD(P)-binding protein [Planococcus faecalis]|uniref:NAD(P)-binding protein n=1 Tax=Planococcus faecalis TaxID=1598147 RepID=UPI002737C429|nr:NAD(P)-binding protein [Planococcus faecalis]